MNKVIALAASDIHLSHSPPLARSCEPDWYEAMRRTLHEVCEIQAHYMNESDRRVPFLISGDLFHKWNAPAELINFAMAELPLDVVAIPGQHDLPNHSLEYIGKSAYWTLVQAERIVPLSRINSVENFQGIRINGAPWGCDPPPIEKKSGVLNICLWHKYLWNNEENNPARTEEGRASCSLDKIQNYDLILTGDNHHRFNWGKIVNNGCLIRRNANERDFVPSITRIYEDGTWDYLSLESYVEDRWLETTKLERAGQIEALTFALKGIFRGFSSLEENLNEACRTTGNERVSEIIREIIEE